MSLQQRWIQVRGHQLYLEVSETESSPLFVLLHHGLGSVRSWRSQINFLSEKGFAFWAYDRWGYGKSSDRLSLDPPFFEEDVQDLEILLSDVKVPILMVGHSDGGNIALTYASRYPDNLLGLIVVAAHIYFEPKMAEGIEQLLTSYRENDAFRKGLQSAHEGKPVFERWYEAWTKQGTEWDLRQIFHQITCPVMVVQGSEDEHATVQHAVDCAASLVNGHLRIIEGSNHMLPQQASNVFNQILIESLKDFQKVVKHVQ